ncbi:hypothetical protein D1007_31400 [Hordeum vulgare]|nr:hypothetical protein D1007_56582 [Hordeum vulgare]KAE8793817.1 hypothetical protein D1007_31400 [Hordeum vulgare]
MAGSFQNKGKSSVYPARSPHRPRECASVPVHQARWHWEHRAPLPYPNVTLLHHYHLDLTRIPVSALSRSARMHANEVSRHRRQLTPEQWLNPVYTADSPHWEVWFAMKHEEQRRPKRRDGLCVRRADQMDKRRTKSPSVWVDRLELL